MVEELDPNSDSAAFYFYMPGQINPIFMCLSFFIYKIGIITVILPTLYFTEDQVKSCMHKHLMKYKVCANIKNFIISVNIKS